MRLAMVLLALEEVRSNRLCGDPVVRDECFERTRRPDQGSYRECSNLNTVEIGAMLWV
jgi:hypothetical protein